MTAHDPKNNDPNLRSGLSADYTEPETASDRTGLTHERMPAKTKKSRAGLWVGLLGLVVVGLLVSRMPFLAGSLNAGAPVDAAVTGSIGDANEVDTSSALPTPNEITPSTVPAE